MRARPAWSGQVIPAEISIYTDNSFTFVLKTPPTPDLLRKAAGVEKGSSTPNKQKVAQDQPQAGARNRRDEDEGHERVRHRRRRWRWWPAPRAAWASRSRTNVEVGGSRRSARLHHQEITMAKHGKKYNEAATESRSR